MSVIDDDTIQLLDENGAIVPLTSLGEGMVPHELQFARTAVDLDQSTVRLNRHGLVTGQSVRYHNGGGTDIGGLTDGAEYFVIVIDADTIQLASTREDAIDGVSDVTPTDVGTGKLHRFRIGA